MAEEQIMKPSVISKTEIYIAAVSFCLFLGILLYTFFYPNTYTGDLPAAIDINRGESFSAIAESLYVKKIIPSKFNLKVMAYIYGADKKIKAGRYEIPNRINYIRLIEILTAGTLENETLVTLPEGIWQPELAQILKKDLGLDSAKIIQLSGDAQFIKSLGLNANNLEGYLLPETYYFYSNSSAEDVLRRLKLNMDKFFTPEYEQRIKDLGLTRHKLLTIASIVDGESNKVSEFKTIAGVYYNRLKAGMPLQADPTIQYLIRYRTHNRILSKDLLIQSRYNTYLYAGLPPAPINNPGKDAIIAALYPDKHNYLYFVADGTGGHVFAKSFEEHQKNVARYRKWRRTQN